MVFVIIIIDGGKSYTFLKRRNFGVIEVTVGGFDMFDKAEVVRNNFVVYRKKLDEFLFIN